MILGIGTDLAQIKRYEENLKKLNNKLIEKHFSKKEQEDFQNKLENQQASFTAKRFAAKEAISKALGTGIRNQIYLKDIEIQNNDLGAPYATLYNGALKQLEKLCPKGYQGTVHLSLSDDGDYAQAFAIIEALKDE